MILSCVCGRRFRTPNESDSKQRSCPQCGGTLVPENESLVPAIDINVLLEQMKVLRDELVARDRQLRRAQAESTVLRAELDQLRARVAVLQAPAPSPVTPPVAVQRDLPSNRVPLFAFPDP
jgi:hypothetical protein